MSAASPHAPADPRKRLTLMSLRVSNLGPLTGTLDLGALDPGLTVITGPNETGKSTLIAGLRAAFFERYSARNKAIRSLQPHGTNLAPELWVSFRHDGQVYELHKRFLAGPLAELRAEAEGTTHVREEAEARLREILGSHKPGKRGAHLDDMGLWGLLWVGQDDAAYTDPGQRLGDSTRGTIQEAIERQVASVTGGGRVAELLRAKAREEYLRYWTEQTGKPGGEYRTANEAVDQAEAAHTAAQRELDETRQLRDQLQALTSQRETLQERDLPTIQRRLEDTRAEAARLRDAQAALEAARAARDQAVALAEAARARRDERHSLAEEAQRAQAAAQAERAAQAELEPVATAAAQARDAAQTRARDAEAAYTEAMEALETARRQLARAEHRARRQAHAAKRRQLAGVRAETQRRRRALDETLTDEAFKALQEAHQARQEARQELERVATRFELRGEGSGEGGEVVLSRLLGRPEEIAWPGAGAPLTVRLTPAREGLREALARLREADRGLTEALRPLRVSPGKEALKATRALRAERSEHETRYQLATEELEREAPEGLDALRAEAQAAEAQVATLRERARRGAELAAAVAAARARAREAGVSSQNLADLEKLQQRLEVAVAARDASATRLVVRALRPTRVRGLDEGEGEGGGQAGEDGSADGPLEGRALDAGESLARHLTRATTVRIGEEAEVRVEPGGERLANVALEVREAQRRLEDALAELGCADLEEARRRAVDFAVAEREVQEARAALKELIAAGEGGGGPGPEAGALGGAPGGAPDSDQPAASVAGLEAAREAAEVRLKDLQGRLRRAAQASERRRVAEARRDANPVTAEAFKRVEELAAQVAQARAIVDRLSAQVAVVDDPGDGEGAARWTFTEAGVATLGAGRGVRVEPGEGGAAEAALARQAQTRWAEALEAAGVADLEAAEEAWRRGVTLREQVRALEDAEAALVAEVGEAGDDTSDGEEADGAAEEADGEVRDLETARGAVTEAEATSQVAREALDEARREAAEASERAAVVEAKLRERRAGVDRAEQHAKAEVQRLEAARAVAGDDALEEEARRQQAAVVAREEALAAATAAKDEAAAALVEEDALERAEAALAHAKRQDEEWGQEIARLEGQLATVMRKGRFNALEEAKAALQAASEHRDAVKRRALAAQKLWKTLSEEYERYQRLFLAPIVKRATPYLRAVRPDSELQMTSDFRVQAVVRRGVEEGFESLSGGTREQLSVIVRLAFAGMLAESHGALPLILDDTMGWTDDQRFGKMVRILEDAARHMQILVLTCHPSRFIALNAPRTIDLGRLRREARQG